MKLDGEVVFIILFYCITTLYSHQTQGVFESIFGALFHMVNDSSVLDSKHR